jgi:hypothetical protein
MIERHHDYILRNINVSAGQSVQFVVKLDSDAPFALRQILSLNMEHKFQMIIQGYDDRRYMGGQMLAAVDSLLNPGFAFIVYPQITFPTQLSILVTINEIAGTGIDGGVLCFRGTKLFNDGTVFGPAYPSKFSELCFRYPYNFTVAQGTGPNPFILGSQPLNVKADADFVVRMGSAFVQPGADGYSDSGNDVVLSDQYGKPYSSDSTGIGPGWVPTHFLFPVPNAEHVFVPDVTIYPEIYVLRNSQLLLDIRRTNGTQANIMNFILHGAKVFPLT